MMNSFEFSPSEREFEFDIDSGLCIMRQFVVIVELDLVLAELQKNSISIWENSRERKVNMRGVISLRKDLPI